LPGRHAVRVDRRKAFTQAPATRGGTKTWYPRAVRSGPSLLVAVSLALGCGARSELESPGAYREPGMGAGGVGGGGASGAGGGGGLGGAAACDDLVVRDGFRSFDASIAGWLAYQPRLAATRADGHQVTLVVREQPDPVPIDGNPVLTRVAFEPWDSWTGAPLGTALQLSAGNDFVLPRRAEDGLSAWVFSSTFATGPQMVLFQAVPSDVANPVPIVAYPEQTHVPAFVTAPLSGSRGLGRIEPVAQAIAWLDVADDVGLHPSPSQLGCFLVDGVSSADAFLFACSSPDGFELGRFGPTTPDTNTTHLQLTTAPMQLQLVPRGSGAWVIWQPADGETSGSLLAMQLDSSGMLASEEIQLVPDGIVFDRVAAAPLSDGLAIAYSDVLDPGPPNIVVQIFDEEGVERAATSFTPQAWPRIAEGYGLIGSPAGDALLLSWSSADPEPDVAGDARTYVARLDCAP